MSKKLFKIGDLAEHFGISTDIIRHYDKIGLLRPQIVKENGYRYYSIDQLFDLEFILNMRTLDMPLQNIGDLLDPEHTVDIYSRLETQAKALKEQIDNLQLMLDKTDHYKSLVKPDAKNLNTWYIGRRPDIHHLSDFFSIKDSLTLSDFRSVTGSLKKNWFQDMKFFIRSEWPILQTPENFEELSSFSYGSYDEIPVKHSKILPSSKALVFHFHNEESQFDSCYHAAYSKLMEMGIEPKGFVYSLDAFGWRSKGKLYLSTDLYIDLD